MTAKAALDASIAHQKRGKQQTELAKKNHSNLVTIAGPRGGVGSSPLSLDPSGAQVRAGFCRAMLCKRGLCCHAVFVCLYVCLCVCARHVRTFYQNE